MTMETALFSKGREIKHIKGYARQNAALNTRSGGIAFFPDLGDHGELYEIDSAVLFFPDGGNDYVRILPIQPPGDQGLYRHTGGTGLCLRFHLQGSAAKATERTQALTDAMRDILDRLDAVEVTNEHPAPTGQTAEDLPF